MVEWKYNSSVPLFFGTRWIFVVICRPDRFTFQEKARSTHRIIPLWLWCRYEQNCEN